MADPTFTSSAFNTSTTALIHAQTFNWVADINASFLLQSGYLVFIMQLGFALLTVGCVRAKSAKSVCLKNIMDAAFGGIGYWFFGWAFAYGDKQSCDASGTCTNVGNPFIGTSYFAMSETADTQYATFIFQYVFAISTATIVSGAVAERVKFIAYAFYAFFLTAWVYPGAVHMVGGVAGLAGAWVAGPRIGRFGPDGKPRDIPGHNAVFYMAGVILLWFGFYGFNPGTMGQIINATDGTSFSMVVARCAVSTTLGACFGGATALLIHVVYTKITKKQAVWDLYAAGNGALTGCIVITSGCAMFEPWAAAIGGIVGGVIILPSSWFWLHVAKIDDPVDAITVHLVGGAAGVIFYALLAKKEYIAMLYGEGRHYGCFMGDNGTVLAANVVWVIIIFGWVMGNMLPFFYGLKLLGWLRITPEEEEVGADVSKHGGPAFPGLEPLYVEYEASHRNGLNGEGKPVAGHHVAGNGADAGLHKRVADLEAKLAAMNGTGKLV